MATELEAELKSETLFRYSTELVRLLGSTSTQPP
jgi:hypothetical protein